MWPAGVEPATPRVSDGHSTALSYDHASTRARPPSISPREEIDAAARLLASAVAPSETSALFSMPLAHPSTLDRRPRADRARMVAVLRGGALEPDPQSVPKICTPNTCAYRRAYFRVNAKSLSLSSGASIRSRASSSWASPFFSSTSFASETTKATHRVALEKLLCASDLAHSPLHEGCCIPRPAQEAGRRVSDGLPRSGIGRFGEVCDLDGGIRHMLVPFRLREYGHEH